MYSAKLSARIALSAPAMSLVALAPRSVGVCRRGAPLRAVSLWLVMENVPVGVGTGETRDARGKFRFRPAPWRPALPARRLSPARLWLPRRGRALPANGRAPYAPAPNPAWRRAPAPPRR